MSILNVFAVQMVRTQLFLILNLYIIKIKMKIGLISIIHCSKGTASRHGSEVFMGDMFAANNKYVIDYQRNIR